MNEISPARIGFLVDTARDREHRVGSEYLVARRVLDDGSGTVIYGTIEGLVSGSAAARP